MPEPLAVVADPRQAAALLHPARARLLEVLGEPRSAAAAARALGLPRQKVNYHVRELEAAGLVEHVEDRRRGNCVERIVRATALRYVLSPAVLGSLQAEPEIVKDRFSSAYLVAVAARTVSEVSELRDRAAAAGKELPAYTLQTEVAFASAADQHAYAEALTTAVERLARRYHRPDAPRARRFRFNVHGFPALPGASTGDTA